MNKTVAKLLKLAESKSQGSLKMASDLQSAYQELTLLQFKNQKKREQDIINQNRGQEN